MTILIMLGACGMFNYSVKAWRDKLYVQSLFFFAFGGTLSWFFIIMVGVLMGILG